MMANLSRDSSPDPITLPSSPIAPHSFSPRRTSARPLAQKSTNIYSSPSKSIFLDTPKDVGASPWRIRVTVQAEPKENSPRRRTSTPSSMLPKELHRPNSPAKRTYTETIETVEAVQPQRKRKNTPVHQRTISLESGGNFASLTEANNAVEAASVSPLKQPPRRRSRISALPANSGRSKRFNIARDELDNTVDDTVGLQGSKPLVEAPGDTTVSANEDFSMVIMESLQTVKEHSFSNMSRDVDRTEDSVASVSRLPSSPPAVQYPDLSNKAINIGASLGDVPYDAMSWKPTGPVTVVSPPEATETDTPVQNAHTSGWSGKRYRSNPTNDNLHQVDITPTPISQQNVTFEDGDIWQEEASRSIGAGKEHTSSKIPLPQVAGSPRIAVSPKIRDLFDGQQSKPPRSKIPRTWRKNSGKDFSYADSPAHSQGSRKQSGASTDDSGIVTPPGTDEEFEGDHNLEESQGNNSSHSELFQPDRAATELQNKTSKARIETVDLTQIPDDASSPYSDDSSDDSSPDGEDTGLFWQSNMPQVYQHPWRRPRPQRETTVDLAEFLNLDGTKSPVKRPIPQAENISTDRATKASVERPAQRPFAASRMRHVESRIQQPSQSERDKSKAITSPLRKSLLRSSQIRDVKLSSHEGNAHILESIDHRPIESQHPRPVKIMDAGINRRFESKVNDQNAIWSDNGNTHNGYHGQALQGELEESDAESSHEDRSEHLGEEVRSNQSEEYEDEFSNEYDYDGIEPSHSYEEHLNLESPQKVPVQFNDSGGNSTLLAPSKQYPPLFGQASNTRRSNQALAASPVTKSPPTLTLISKKSETPAPTTGFLSRLTTNFWSAVMRPTGPTEMLPLPQDPIQFPMMLRTKIRNRYGIVAEEFPWTMCHIRTLHRMLNSATSNGSDTIIPSSGPLPSCLTRITDTTQTSVTGYRFTFTKAHAYVVFSFFQVTVPVPVVQAMQRGEIELLGDTLAKQIRSYYGGRHGSESVWRENFHNPSVVRWVNGLKGKIDVNFVVRALGDAVWSNDQLAAKERAEGKA